MSLVTDHNSTPFLIKTQSYVLGLATRWYAANKFASQKIRFYEKLIVERKLSCSIKSFLCHWPSIRKSVSKGIKMRSSRFIVLETLTMSLPLLCKSKYHGYIHIYYIANMPKPQDLIQMFLLSMKTKSENHRKLLWYVQTQSLNTWKTCFL